MGEGLFFQQLETRFLQTKGKHLSFETIKSIFTIANCLTSVSSSSIYLISIL